MKIITEPSKAVVTIEFDDLKDLQCHVRNLGKMLEHNLMHENGEELHLKYVIESSSGNKERS